MPRDGLASEMTGAPARVERIWYAPQVVCSKTPSVCLLVLASVLSVSCKGARPTSERVAEVEAALSEELGTEVKVHCPTMIDNSYHYCTAEVTGREDLVFPVRIKPRGGDVDYTTKRWVTGARMVALGKHHFGEKFGITVDSLTCPMISHMPDGTKVRCEARIEGVDVPVEVSMVTKVNKLSFEPVGGVVFGGQAAERAKSALRRDEGLDADVTCPQPVIVSVPGKRFECEATVAGETARTVHFLITDTDGNFALGTEPPTAERAEKSGPPTEEGPKDGGAPAASSSSSTPQTP